MPDVFARALAAGFAALLLLAPAAAPAAAQDTVSLASPDGRIVIEIDDQGGAGRYRVLRDDEIVLDWSGLGLRFREGGHLDRGLEIAGSQTRSHSEVWEQPWGERRVVTDRHEELAVDFVRAEGGAAAFTLRARAFDDGIAFRYESPGEGERFITDELTQFAIPGNPTVWWIPAGGWNRYEYLYRTTGLDAVDRAHTPMTMRLENGLHLAFHEAALIDYAGMWLDQRRPGLFEAELAPRSDGMKVRVEGDFTTPWRVVQIAETASGLINGSDIYLNLNAPNALGDVSWVEPGKYVGVWWGMHLGVESWGSGPIHGANNENVRRYIDFAAENGFDGVLVEGWNIGWDGDWFFNGELFRFTEAYPDFDIEALSAYAAERGVRLIGHHETSGAISNYEAQMEAAFDLYQRLGYAQIKTGYVADGGDMMRRDENGVRQYEWHDGQAAVDHHLRVLQRAAEHNLSINAHEPVKDTGLRRTYPNAMTREGARGQEYNAWGQPPNSPEHTTILPYTRMLSGPMDFTPGIFDLTFERSSGDRGVRTTLAKQLALYVVIYSPLQMAADLPENYQARPEPFQFIRDVPADWEESIALQGEIGEFTVIARQERGGPDWYLGALTDEEARDLRVPLDFLERGVQYEAQIYRDGPDAHWLDNPYDLTIETRLVSSRDALDLKLGASGGAAVRFRAIDHGEQGAGGRLIEIENFASDHVEARNLTIWLPPGYEGGDQAYPVLYMHDGQNLFRPGFAYGGEEWGVDEAMAAGMADGSIRPAIVVGVWNTPLRSREYGPQRVIESLDPEVRAMIEEGYGGPAVSDSYLRFLTEELKPFIDAEYRTLTGPEDTLIAGSSMGGLITLYALSEYGDVFGAGAAVSTHWPTATSALDTISREDWVDVISPAYIAYFEAQGPDPASQRVWTDHGDQTLDALYPPYHEAIIPALEARGFVRGEGFQARAFPGAAHNEAAWRARIGEILTFLLPPAN